MVLGRFGGAGKGEDVGALIAKKNFTRAIEVIREQLLTQRNDPRLRLQLADVLVSAGRTGKRSPSCFPWRTSSRRTASRPRRSRSSRRSRRSIPAGATSTRAWPPSSRTSSGWPPSSRSCLRAARSSWGWRRSGSSRLRARQRPRPHPHHRRAPPLPRRPPRADPGGPTGARRRARSRAASAQTRAGPGARAPARARAGRGRARVRPRYRGGSGGVRRAPGPRSRAGSAPAGRGGARASRACPGSAGSGGGRAPPSRSWRSLSSTRTCSRGSSSPSRRSSNLSPSSKPSPRWPIP
jgi:hypothetical protein